MAQLSRLVLSGTMARAKLLPPIPAVLDTYRGFLMPVFRSLMNQLIDYAGLFPPAALPMESVVENFAKYRQQPNKWVLGRVVIPAARLSEFEQLAAKHLPIRSENNPWRVSLLVPSVDAPDEAFKFAVSGIKQFNDRHRDSGGHAIVDVVEIKTPTLSHIKQTMEQLPEDLAAFMEIPHAEDPGEMIASIATHSNDNARFFAKIRTGGVTPNLIPDSGEVARFIAHCGENLVGMKATAGLHHPLRDEFNLTYEKDSPRGTMHGFLNVFVAAALSYNGLSDSRELKRVLETTSISDFEFSPTHLGWNGHRISATRLGRIRKLFAISFGSCSFDEPTVELTELGVGAELASAQA